MGIGRRNKPEPVVLLTKDELTMIEYHRNVMGGYITYASEASKPAFVQAFDDSKRLQEQVAALQREIGPLRERVETQSGMIKDLLEEAHGRK